MQTFRICIAIMKRHILWLAPLLAVLLGERMFVAGWPINACLVGGMTLICALWWMLEAIPIPATSLIPLALFPLLGLLTPAQVASSYGHPLILLLLGGAMLSKAMEKSGAHVRIALTMVRLFGGSSERRLVLGFMAASAVLSMWISNTATTLMLLPVAMAILEKTQNRPLVVAILLGIAYAASIGGLGTPIGTPTNVVMMGIYQSTTGNEVSFLGWMALTIPIVVVLIPVTAIWLSRHLNGKNQLILPKLGCWRLPEKRVLTVFAITALAWITLKHPYGGWGQWLPHASYGSVALMAVLALFMISDGEDSKLLNWQYANTIHWGVLILFASGIAIAKAFTSVGLSAAIGNAMSDLTTLPIFLLLLTLVLCITFLTEITSNTATATLLMPILATAAISNEMNPTVLMLPAAMATSCAFMLPVATPPNAIVFGTDRIQISDMIRQGLVINLIAAISIASICYLFYVIGLL